MRVLAPLLPRVIALAFLAGLWLSPRLWFGQRTWPTVAIIDGLPPIVAPFDTALFVLLIVLLGAIVVVRSPRRWILAILGILGIFVVTDITRLQPWVYQYAAMLGAFAFCAGETRQNVCRFIIVATYVWSGVQKLNPHFPQDTFPLLAAPLLPSDVVLAPSVALGGALCVAAGETLFGLGLLLRPTRRIATLLVVGMHLLILLSIGPLGDNWNSVVWPWNVAMMATVVMLFWKWDGQVDEAWKKMRREFPPNMRPRYYAFLTIAAFGCLPLLSFFGWWDSQLSASLYSGNVDEAGIVVVRRDQLDLPERLAPRFAPDRLLLLDWSMQELHVPPYPALRAHRSVFRSLCRFTRDPKALLLLVHTKWLWTGPQEDVLETCPGSESDHP